MEKIEAYTTPDPSQPTGVTLHLWSVFLAETHVVTIQFSDWKGVQANTTESAAFKRTFHIPEQCHPNHKCSNSDDDDIDDDDASAIAGSELRKSPYYNSHQAFIRKWLRWGRRYRK